MIVDGELITYLAAGTERIMGILDLDATASGVPRRVLAETYLDKIRTAVEKYRADRTAERFGQAVKLALLATAAVLAVILALRFLRRALLRRFESRYHARIASLKFKSLEVVGAERIWTALIGAFRLLSLTVGLVAVFLYLDFVLALFPQTRLLSDRLLEYLLSPLGTIARSLIGLVPNLLFIAVVAVLARYALKLLRLIFTEVSLGRIEFAGFQPEWALPVYGLVRLAVVAFAVVVAFPYIPGSSSPAFQGVTIFLGAVLSLGSTGVIGNLLAGYVLIFQRPFALGDRVRIGEVVGDVVESSLIVTRLRTIKNEVVTVPNSAIVGGHVVNYSSLARKGGLILHTAITIGYDTPWRQVEALLIAAAETDGGRAAGARPLRAADGARRLLRELRAERVHRPPRADGRDLRRPAPERPGLLQRVRRADHLAELRARPRAGEGGAAGAVVRGPRAPARSGSIVMPATSRRCVPDCVS